MKPSTKSIPAPFQLFRTLVLVCVLTVIVDISAHATSVRERDLMDSGWRFHLGDPADVLTNAAETNVTYYPEIPDLTHWTSSEVTGTSSETYMETLRADPVATHMGENVPFVQTNYDDSSWTNVNLPHDWVVDLPFNSSADQGHGYKPVGTGFGTNSVGWYRKTFTLPAGDAGRTIWLEFDGAYRNTLVWLNGHILGRNVSGYTSFYFDISQYVNPGGTNVLVARVDANRFEGWFYEGAGIYRHVWLEKTTPVHVAHWGTFVTNNIVGSMATLTLQTTVQNSTSVSTNCTLVSTIIDNVGVNVATATNMLTIPANTNQTITQTITVSDAKLWSLQNPNLYQWIATIAQASITNDTYVTRFGIRSIRFDPVQGLLLNGQRVEIKGASIHQDHAGVGVAVPDRVQYYRLQSLKAMGYNAVTIAVNPPSPALLDACDNLGVILFDGARRFGTNAEPVNELSQLIYRDRNHPCVFAWVIGDEEPLLKTSSAVSLIQKVQSVAHSLDPTRNCTMNWASGNGTSIPTNIDLLGYEYVGTANLDTIHSTYANKPIYGSEEGATPMTRGIYSNTTVYKDAYPTNIPSWGNNTELWWPAYLARQWDAGAFTWAGIDYRGEPSPFSYPNISSQYGVMDTCCFPKDLYYYFQANWTSNQVLHVFPHWTWPGKNGQPIAVWAYANVQAVELFLNGASQGRKTVSQTGHLTWSVNYAPGTLQAVGYNNGLPVITNTQTTANSAAALVLQPDRTAIAADGQDVSLVTVSVVDGTGNFVPTATNLVNFSISGGSIIGVGNGDPACLQSDHGNQRSLFSGLAQVIIQSTNQAGPITLTATSSGLSQSSVTINTVANLQSQASLAIQSIGGNMVLTWPVGTLLQSPNVSGPWQATGATSPYSFAPNAIQSFYRISPQ